MTAPARAPILGDARIPRGEEELAAKRTSAPSALDLTSVIRWGSGVDAVADTGGASDNTLTTPAKADHTNARSCSAPPAAD
jgi:hypothetical protein